MAYKIAGRMSPTSESVGGYAITDSTGTIVAIALEDFTTDDLKRTAKLIVAALNAAGA